jgi:SsrA-binding protein
MIHKGEAYLVGCHISPLKTASTRISPNATRERKLLLHHNELDKLIASVDRKGYSIVPTAMYWVRGRAKLEIALAKGKQQHDKRASEKSRDWEREKSRIMKH